MLIKEYYSHISPVTPFMPQYPKQTF